MPQLYVSSVVISLLFSIAAAAIVFKFGKSPEAPTNKDITLGDIASAFSVIGSIIGVVCVILTPLLNMLVSISFFVTKLNEHKHTKVNELFSSSNVSK